MVKEELFKEFALITQDYRTSFEDKVNQILALGKECFNLDIAIISHIVKNTYTVDFCQVPEGAELAPGNIFEFDKTYCYVTIGNDEVVAIEHVAEDDVMGKHPAYAAFGLESYIGIPIHVGKQTYGTVNFSSAQPYPRQFNQSDIDIMMKFTDWVGMELLKRQAVK